MRTWGSKTSAAAHRAHETSVAKRSTCGGETARSLGGAVIERTSTALRARNSWPAMLPCTSALRVMAGRTVACGGPASVDWLPAPPREHATRSKPTTRDRLMLLSTRALPCAFPTSSCAASTQLTRRDAASLPARSARFPGRVVVDARPKETARTGRASSVRSSRAHPVNEGARNEIDLNPDPAKRALHFPTGLGPELAVRELHRRSS